MDIDTQFMSNSIPMRGDSKAFLPTNVPFDNSYLKAASQMAQPYQDFAAELGYGGDPTKIQGIGSDVRHTVGSAKGKFAVQDYLKNNFALPTDNFLSNFLGNAAIYGSTFAQEIPDAIKNIPEGGINFYKQPLEDIKANLRATSLPYGTKDAELLEYAVNKSPSKNMIQEAKGSTDFPMGMIRLNRFPPDMRFPVEGANSNYKYGTVKADDIIPVDNNLLTSSIVNQAFKRAPNEEFQQILDEEYEKGEMMDNVADAPKDSLLSKILEFAPLIGDKSLTGILTNALGGAKDKLTGFRDAIGTRLGPASYGTSQAAFNAMTPSQQQAVGSIYGPGGIMQGYNAVSAFGRGPAGAIQNRIDNILGRKAAQTAISRQRVKDLQAALTNVGGGDSGGGGGYSQSAVDAGVQAAEDDR